MRVNVVYLDEISLHGTKTNYYKKKIHNDAALIHTSTIFKIICILLPIPITANYLDTATDVLVDT